MNRKLNQLNLWPRYIAPRTSNRDKSLFARVRPTEDSSGSGSFIKRDERLGEGLLDGDNLENFNLDGKGNCDGLPGLDSSDSTEEDLDLFGVDVDEDVLELAGEKNFLISLAPMWGFFFAQLIAWVFLL